VRPIIVLLMAWCLSMGAYAATAPDAKQITQELEQAKAANPLSQKPSSRSRPH
jgi:potassium efflux system protein